MVPWLPEAIRTVVTAAIYALYDFFNAAGKFIFAQLMSLCNGLVICD